MRSVVTLLHALHERGNKLRSNATEGLVITLLTRRRSLSWIFYDGARLLTLTKYSRPCHKGVCAIFLFVPPLYFSSRGKRLTKNRWKIHPPIFFFSINEMNKLMEDTRFWGQELKIDNDSRMKANRLWTRDILYYIYISIENDY